MAAPPAAAAVSPSADLNDIEDDADELVDVGGAGLSWDIAVPQSLRVPLWSHSFGESRCRVIALS